ncbi:PREDICTED: uncharacterized membrane protein At1g75140-like [Tarenaya hassleriana]|uniref:uncharacterized membrane protein At1g75140-like n=1 Tax=Tarenaya hassleriana TaxID=28532 RepID=UPI00053C46EF|nr:PREDICTED: uncharacterized membrane protein At1g75140-like [Tarenaya hassleriana]
MADHQHGKFSFFLFSFVVSLSVLLSLSSTGSLVLATTSGSVSITQETDDVCPDGGLISSKSDGQTDLLHKLEDLVRNLTEVVARLDARLSETQVSQRVGEDCDFGRSRKPLKERSEIGQRKNGDEIEHDRDDANDEEEEDYSSGIKEKAKAFTVTKYSSLWSERFQFTSAVKLDSDATCLNVLPFRDHEGLSKYFAVGDSRGRVYVFLRNGDVLVEFFTASDSPITAMISYLSAYKNDSFLVTGHQNGDILLHRVQERSNGEDWNSVSMEHVGKCSGTGDAEDVGVPVTLLEVHHVGRVRYILATDLSGKLTVYTENGTVYGSAMPTSRPLVFLKQRLLFLTETGAGSLDLRSMKIRESECDGLNHSLARTYVFDATERSKAYGFTSEGEIIHVLLLGDVMNFKCRVRSKRKFQMEEPVVIQAIKGYLLVVDEEKVFIYNVSTQHYVRTSSPRLTLTAGLDEIRSTFLNRHDPGGRKVTPLMASDRDKIVVMSLGDGYIATYRSKLPVFKGEFNATMLWSSPVFFFLLFLFGAWHFFAKKKDALTSWGPDDPFASERSDDLMELRRNRTTAMVGSYSSGGSNDSSSRAQVDQNYRATGPEIKYRGSSLQSTGFGQRRESLFVNNNKVVEDES